MAEDGAVCALESGMVNEYLRTTTCCDFTAKDFRTWGGTVHTAQLLYAAGPATTEKASEQTTVDTIKAVAQVLGNTPAVCRAHYVHPAVLESYRTQTLFQCYQEVEQTHQIEQHGLSLDEAVVLALLREDGLGQTENSA
jgi:DNA topoisomerase-1